MKYSWLSLHRRARYRGSPVELEGEHSQFLKRDHPAYLHFGSGRA
jgi:hypothetical protein